MFSSGMANYYNSYVQQKVIETSFFYPYTYNSLGAKSFEACFLLFWSIE